MKPAVKAGRILFAVIFFFYCWAPAGYAAKKRSFNTVSAQSAILWDSASGKRLYAKNSETKVKPASTVKVMTALLVMERLPLTKVITVKRSMAGVPPSKIDLQPGESYRVADLLYALLLGSANDASIVLAEAAAGSEAEFVRLMNQRAREIGAVNTKFANSNGLPTKKGAQYTTASDMCLIFRQAMRQSFFVKAIARPYKAIYSQEGRRVILKNHNKLLFLDWGKQIHGKTGYTRSAQSCFVGYYKKGERTLLIAVFGCSRRWDDIKLITTRYGR